MHRNIALFFTCLAAIFVLQSCLASAIIQTYVSPTFYSAGENVNAPSQLFYNQSGKLQCNFDYISYGSFTGTNYVITDRFYSPHGIEDLVSNIALHTDVSCIYVGDKSVTRNIDGLFELATQLNYTGTSAAQTLESSMSCSIEDENWVTIQNAVSSYYYGTGGYTVPLKLIYDNFNVVPYYNLTRLVRCGNTGNMQSGAQPVDFGTPAYDSAIWFYPVNSTAGVINWTFNGTVYCGAYGCRGGYFKKGEATMHELWSQLGNYPSPLSLNYNGQLNNLDENTEYIFYHVVSDSASSHTNNVMNPLQVNLTVNIHMPMWNCTYGPCIDGDQYKYCNDLEGIKSDTINYVQCWDFARKAINLGFDDYYTLDTFYCKNGVIFSGCNPSIDRRDRKYPTGWNIPNRTIVSPFYGTGYLYDMIDMTSETGKFYRTNTTHNDLSLKMWYIPKKEYLPTFNDSGIGDVRCNATSEGRLPSVWYDNIDSAFFISHNFTALTPYMALTFREVRCDDVVQQGTGDYACLFSDFGCNATYRSLFNPLLQYFWTGFADFYTADGCPANGRSVPASLVTQIIDLTTNTSNSISEGDTEIIAYEMNDDNAFREYQISNMDINHSYEVRFAINPPNMLDDMFPYCIHLDDVNIVFRNEAPNCNIHACQEANNYDYNGDGIPDYTYLDTQPISGGGCKLVVTEMSPSCVPSTIATEVADIISGKSTNNYTCLRDSLDTMAVYDAGIHKWSYITNSSTCIAERLAREAAEAALATSTGVIALFGPSGMNLTGMLEAQGLGFVEIFLTPIFWVFLIAAVVGGYVGLKSKVPEIGLATMMGILIIAALPQFGIFPPWFIIVFIIIAGLVFADFMNRRFSNKS